MRDAVVSLISLALLFVVGAFVGHNLAEHLFLAVAAVIVFAATRVVLSNQAIHSALFLMLTFFSSAVLWVIQGAEFVGAVLLMVYVGAVMVLLLFVIMMVYQGRESVRQLFWKHFSAAFVVAVLVLFEMMVVMWRVFWMDGSAFAVKSAETSQTAGDMGLVSFAQLLFGAYAPAFEIVGFILMVAMIGALVLTLQPRKNVKTQDVTEQISVKKSDRLLIRRHEDYSSQSQSDKTH